MIVGKINNWWHRLPTHNSAKRDRSVTLGTYRVLHVIPKALRLTYKMLRSHMHVLGKTGSGKSYFLAGLFLALHESGFPVTLVDPHGDLAELVLSYMVQNGEYKERGMFEKLMYLDLREADCRKLYVPFNFLDQPYGDQSMSELVAEAFKRAWPELATGAPTFENILKHSVMVLRQNGLPLTKLTDILTDTGYRNTLLKQVTDEQVVSFFHGRMDQWGKEAPLMRESTLNRSDLLTFTHFLRYSLGNRKNTLDFRRIIDEGKSVVINLAVPYHDARRLFGCLLTVGYEAAALSRANRKERDRGKTHHLIIDEFSEFASQSQRALSRMLSECRKYFLFLVMANQTRSQTAEGLEGALQNIGIEWIFKSGRFDAEYSAKILAWVNPWSVKHRVPNEEGGLRTHPAYLPVQEQWERFIQQIQYLKTGQCLVKLPNDNVHKVKIKRLPRLTVSDEAVDAVKEEYLRRYFEKAPQESPERPKDGRYGAGGSKRPVWVTRVPTKARVFPSPRDEDERPS